MNKGILSKLRHSGFRILLVTLMLVSKPAFAYQEDTHFIMTFILCRSAGFTQQEALIVAAVDQGMDDSKGTVANGGLGGSIPNINEEWLWHALDMEGNMRAGGIIGRKQELFNLALQQNDVLNKLIYLGVFFHYQQDTWAHREHWNAGHLSMDGYTSYSTPFGHAKDMNQPDRPPFDPVCALMCLEDGMQHACDFLRRGLGREPNAFFAGYQPQGGSIDSTWISSKRGKFFNQIDISFSKMDSTSARYYLTKLIRTQIDQYGISADLSHGLTKTANQADLKKMRDSLQKVCTAFSIQLGIVSIPTTVEKFAMQYNKLTSVGLFALNKIPVMMPGEFYIKVKASGRYLSKDTSAEKLITTRDQPTGDLTVFILEPQPDGTCRIRSKADGICLRLDACDSRHCLNTNQQSDEDDPFTRFVFEKQLGDNDYRIRLKANGRYVEEIGSDTKIFSIVAPVQNNVTRFVLEKK